MARVWTDQGKSPGAERKTVTEVAATKRSAWIQLVTGLEGWTLCRNAVVIPGDGTPDRNC